MTNQENQVTPDSCKTPIVAEKSRQPEASGVERFTVRELWLGNDDHKQVVTAADHDRVVADLQRQLQIREAEIGIGGSPPPYPTWMQQVADRDATIAELRADRQYCFDQMKASDTRAEAAEAKCARLENACSKQQDEIQQILGKALGYPKYADDQKNFPGATGDDVCVGDHVAESLAAEIADRLKAAEARCAEAQEQVQTILRSKQVLQAELDKLKHDFNGMIGMMLCCELNLERLGQDVSSARQAPSEKSRASMLMNIAMSAAQGKKFFSYAEARDLRKANARLTAQLAAVNERIRETYAILCQLDNVYRRQSTESVGSFGVSQEVHSLLKRAMDTLNKKDVNP